MNERTLPPRPRTKVRSGAHRGTRSIASAVLPSLLAVAAVSALITSLAVWQAEEPSSGPGAVAAPASVNEPQTTVTETQTTGPRATPTSGAPTSTTPAVPAASALTAATTMTASPSSPPSKASTTPLTSAAPQIAVVVLNQSSRTGLASSTGAELAERGWTVAAVGNFRGVVPATTVYYPPGAEQQALALAHDLRAEPRIRPRFGNLSTTRLTVVVTASYPG